MYINPGNVSCVPGSYVMIKGSSKAFFEIASPPKTIGRSNLKLCRSHNVEGTGQRFNVKCQIMYFLVDLYLG